MKRIHRHQLKLALIAVWIGGCAAKPHTTISTVPAALKAPQDQVLTLTAHAIGSQIYECRAKDNEPTVLAWRLKGPDAELRYAAGKRLGTHYAGPTWEAEDGSKVIGEVVARDEGAAIKSIPWLLLRAKQTSGDGVFSQVQSIVRLHTAGGLPPTTGCSATYVGTEVRVAYSADYYFYTASH